MRRNDSFFVLPRQRKGIARAIPFFVPVPAERSGARAKAAWETVRCALWHVSSRLKSLDAKRQILLGAA